MSPVVNPKTSLQDLLDNGFLQPVKRGRPCLYQTDDERKTAHKAQQRECMKRHAARMKEAHRLMAEYIRNDSRNNTVDGCVVPAVACS